MPSKTFKILCKFFPYKIHDLPNHCPWLTSKFICIPSPGHLSPRSSIPQVIYPQSFSDKYRCFLDVPACLCKFSKINQSSLDNIGIIIMSKSEYMYLFKVVLVGNSCVGKSSIVIRYADDEFSDVFLATIGVDFRFKSFQLHDDFVKLQIWDTAGQQKFRTITSSYYRGAHALMIVFDITDEQSYEDAIGYWFNQIKNSCPPQTQILLVGNKSDLQHMRKVPIQEINRFISENPQVRYVQASAKTSNKIDEAFETVAGMLLQSQQSAKEKSSKKNKNTPEGNAKLQAENERSSNGYRSYCCQT